MGQAAKREVVPGVGGHTLLRGQVEPGGRAASCLHAGWHLAPERLWPFALCWQGAGGRPRKGSGLPAHRPPQGCVCKGAGHARPANSSNSNRLPGRAPGHSLPPLSSHSLLPSTVLQLRIHRRYQDPSKCGPCTGGGGSPSPPGVQLPGFLAGSRAPVPLPWRRGDPSSRRSQEYRSPAPHPSELLGVPTSSEMRAPRRECPRPHLWCTHTSLRTWLWASLSPQGQEYWPHPCSSKPPDP